MLIKNSRLLRVILVVVLLAAGLAVRLLDLTDPPLDFAATRQLHSLILARGFYYQMDTSSVQSLPIDQRQLGIEAAKQELQVEPVILEKITAVLYALFGRETFVIPRILVSLLWGVGGIPLFLIARRFSGNNGALFALTFYELLPFGVIAGRSFQPDPFMVTVILFAVLFQLRWSEDHSLKNALLAGGFSGLALLIKLPAVFFVGLPFAGVVLMNGIKKAFRERHLALMVALTLLPVIAYYLIYALSGNSTTNVVTNRFFPSLFIQPGWYQRWFMMAKSVVGYIPLFLAILAFFLIKARNLKIVYACLWIGYLLQGFVFAYHISSHDYYQLPLIPVAAIGCGMVFALFLEKIELSAPKIIARLFILMVLIFGTALTVLKSWSEMREADFHYEEIYWKYLGDTIGRESKVTALTHDYGFRLQYWGGILPRLWKTQGDYAVDELAHNLEIPFDTRFHEAIDGSDYFLITLVNDFESQGDLHAFLFSHYPYSQGEGYYLFDLQTPLLVK